MNPVSVEPVRSRTRLTRIADDLAEKLAEIVEAEGTSSAEFLDQLIRPEIERRHTANLSAINVLRKARERARKARGEEADLGGEG